MDIEAGYKNPPSTNFPNLLGPVFLRTQIIFPPRHVDNFSPLPCVLVHLRVPIQVTLQHAQPAFLES